MEAYQENRDNQLLNSEVEYTALRDSEIAKYRNDKFNGLDSEFRNAVHDKRQKELENIENGHLQPSDYVLRFLKLEQNYLIDRYWLDLQIVNRNSDGYHVKPEDMQDLVQKYNAKWNGSGGLRETIKQKIVKIGISQEEQNNLMRECEIYHYNSEQRLLDNVKDIVTCEQRLKWQNNINQACEALKTLSSGSAQASISPLSTQLRGGGAPTSSSLHTMPTPIVSSPLLLRANSSSSSEEHYKRLKDECEEIFKDVKKKLEECGECDWKAEGEMEILNTLVLLCDEWVEKLEEINTFELNDVSLSPKPDNEATQTQLAEAKKLAKEIKTSLEDLISTSSARASALYKKQRKIVLDIETIIARVEAHNTASDAVNKAEEKSLFETKKGRLSVEEQFEKYWTGVYARSLF